MLGDSVGSAQASNTATNAEAARPKMIGLLRDSYRRVIGLIGNALIVAHRGPCI